MNKAELAKAIVSNMKGRDVSQKLATEMIDAFTDAVVKEVKKGGTGQLIGFGTFSSVKRKARNGINLQTKKPMKIPAKTVARFKVGKKFADAVAKKK